jgi:hypothetical protein
MRKNAIIFLVVTIAFLGFAVHNVWILISLLFVDGSEDAISRAEVPAPKSGAISERPQLIPKIIHQTYKNESLPEHWKAPQKSCLDLHPDYEYKVRHLLPLPLAWQTATNERRSSGQIRRHANSLLLNTLGSWKPLMATPTRSSAPTP